MPLRPSTALGFAITLLLPQVWPPAPPLRTQATVTNFERGEVIEVDLATLASDIGQLEKKHVRTRGRLERLTVASLDRFYVLSAGSSHVLVVPGYGFIEDDMDGLDGRQVAARGVVRLLRPNLDRETERVEDPDLPPLPAASPELPRVSLTLLAASRSGDSEPEGGPKRMTADPAAHPGKSVRVLGQFRGRNLFGDLPEGSRRSPDDWVLKAGDACLWVTGKKPRGRGFLLDPDHQPDTLRWLEVTGRQKVVGGVVYLEASKVTLVKRPDSTAGRPR